MIKDIQYDQQKNDLVIVSSELPRAANLIDVQLGQLYYRPDWGVDLEYFLNPDYEIQERVKLKINRSAYVDADDEAFDDIRDYRQKMMKVLRERRKMNATRLVFSHKPSAFLHLLFQFLICFY